MEIANFTIAVIALLLAAISLHRQFFHRVRSLKLAVGWLPKTNPGELRALGMSLVFTNCGTVPVILTKLEMKYSLGNGGGLSPSDCFLKPESESPRVKPGEHYIIQLLMGDKFPHGPVELRGSTNSFDGKGKPMQLYHYPVALFVEFLDDRGVLQYADLPIGERTFSPAKIHDGFTIPSQPIELYRKNK